MTFRQIPYQTEDGPTRIERRLEGETLWLTQSLIADFLGWLFRPSMSISKGWWRMWKLRRRQLFGASE